MKFTKRYLSLSQPEINYLTLSSPLPAIRTQSSARIVTCPWLFPVQLEPMSNEYRQQLDKFLDMGCLSKMFRSVSAKLLRFLNIYFDDKDKCKDSFRLSSLIPFTSAHYRVRLYERSMVLSFHHAIIGVVFYQY